MIVWFWPTLQIKMVGTYIHPGYSFSITQTCQFYRVHGLFRPISASVASLIYLQCTWVIRNCFVIITCMNSLWGNTANIKCENREGYSKAEILSMFRGSLWDRRVTPSLIREHRRQHHVNSLHSAVSAMPCGQRIKATASLIEYRQNSLCWAWRRRLSGVKS